MRISPKSFVTLSVLAAGLLGASSPAHAAAVTAWTSGTFTNHNIITASFLPGKTLLYADDTNGGTNTTGNGVPFTRNDANVTYSSSSSIGSFGGFLTDPTILPGDTTFDTILTTAKYAENLALPLIATLKGLTSGDEYGVLFLAIDSRGASNSRTIRVNDGTTFSPDQRYAWNSIKGGYVTATFTADSATQAFNIKGYEGLVSAIVVYGPAIPEPASLGLLSLGGLALLARRRQK